MMLMTADEKITELGQILEARELENEELKVQADSQTGQSHQSSSSKHQGKEKMVYQQQMRDIMGNVQTAMSAINDVNNSYQMGDNAQAAQQQQMLSQMLIQKLQGISQIVNRSTAMDQHGGGSGNNLASLTDNNS